MRILRFEIWLGVALVAACPASSQLSPGELSQAHAQIDSNRSCLECHRAGKGVDPLRCWSCHETLANRARAGLGLHAQPEYRDCEKCHIEHHGRDFDLIWWGESGVAELDHNLTGLELIGSHSKLACRQCHQTEKIGDPDRLIAVGKDLDRTYLGLSSSCASCHRDPHEGQFAARRCEQCHGLDAWTGAELFDHEHTLFPLTGSHAHTRCASCHEAGGSGGEIRYAGTPNRCADCHRDPHDQRLGGGCSECHSPLGWNKWDRSRFDHQLTRFPLGGRHLALRCDQCHTTRGSFLIAGFESCMTCHDDTHRGRFAARSAGGECSSCHDTQEFVPATFGISDHSLSRFPLSGAHRSLACATCHRPTSPAVEPPEVGVAIGGWSPAAPLTFDLESEGCESCHRNPHGSGIDHLPSDARCESCHRTESWAAVSFDHSQTSFALDGTHRTLACASCHDFSISADIPVLLEFAGAPTSCRGCHNDPHADQFENRPPPGGCERCHQPEGWVPSLSDHSVYPLEGAHSRALCQSCHPTDDNGVVHYVPLARVCSGCHGNELKP